MPNKICYVIIGNPPDADLLNTAIIETELGYESIKATATAVMPERLKNDASFVPDYIFIDWDVDMLKGIKAIPRLSKSAVIIYSREMSTEDMNKAKQLGAAHCLLETANDSALKEVLLNLFTGDHVPFVLAYPMA